MLYVMMAVINLQTNGFFFQNGNHHSYIAKIIYFLMVKKQWFIRLRNKKEKKKEKNSYCLAKKFFFLLHHTFSMTKVMLLLYTVGITKIREDLNKKLIQPLGALLVCLKFQTTPCDFQSTKKKLYTNPFSKNIILIYFAN